MSANTPDSIPTSADPRSRRPLKRRALTPVSAQAATVSSLFSRPDQEIRLPGPNAVAQRAVPEIVTNVQGSSAGAGSGEFHVYKASRRREYERLRRMDEEVRLETEAEAFGRERREREERDAERTRRNREKRRGKKGKGGKVPDGGKAGEGNGEEGKGKIQPRMLGRVDGQPDDEAGAKNGGEEKAVGSNGVVTASQPGLLIHDDD